VNNTDLVDVGCYV